MLSAVVFAALLLTNTTMQAETWTKEKIRYATTDEPIDVVIPAIDKDLETLELCIEGIKENCPQIRRVIVVSPARLTDKAEWFDEAAYPFSKQAVALHLLKGDTKKAQCYVSNPNSRLGWFFQQLLKFYAPLVIPGISSNVLILDADTIFLNPVLFINDSGIALYNTGQGQYNPYFTHAKTLLPGLEPLDGSVSGICHHMLFQRAVLEDLFTLVETHHQIPFWQAFCRCVNDKDLTFAGASEYEIYFSFAFTRTDRVNIRQLKWRNLGCLDAIPSLKEEGYHYASFHAWMRNTR